MLTVLIPTSNRPEFLRTALASVLAQTAVGSVEKVLVSENGGVAASEHVAKSFSALPIEYRFRNPPVPPLEHLPLLLSETKTRLVAILHDDDWWHQDHLANAREALIANPHVSSYWSSFFRLTAESAWMGHWNSSFWAGSGYPPVTHPWQLSEKDVLLACLWCTPIHYSTLVTYTDKLAACYEPAVAQKNVFDNDRLLVAELARHGTTYFNPVPEAFIRFHIQQDTIRQMQTRDRYVEATTHYLLDRAATIGLDVQRELDCVLGSCPASAKSFVFHDFEAASLVALARRNLLPLQLAKHRRASQFRTILKALLPPAIITGARALSPARRRRHNAQTAVQNAIASAGRKE